MSSALGMVHFWGLAISCIPLCQAVCSAANEYRHVGLKLVVFPFFLGLTWSLCACFGCMNTARKVPFKLLASAINYDTGSGFKQ